LYPLRYARAALLSTCSKRHRELRGRPARWALSVPLRAWFGFHHWQDRRVRHDPAAIRSSGERGLGRIGELDPVLAEGPQYPQRHCVLHFAGSATVGLGDLEQKIEIDGVRTERIEPGVDEAGVAPFHYRLQQRRSTGEQIRLGLVEHPERHLVPVHLPPSEVGYFLREELGVADDPQLAV